MDQKPDSNYAAPQALISGSIKAGDRVEMLERNEVGRRNEDGLLLVISNIFMTIAWYGHLKYRSKPLIWVILISWAVALFEYIFQVPRTAWAHKPSP